MFIKKNLGVVFGNWSFFNICKQSFMKWGKTIPAQDYSWWLINSYICIAWSFIGTYYNHLHCGDVKIGTLAISIQSKMSLLVLQIRNLFIIQTLFIYLLF